jgi:hypothetical protein
LNHVDFEQLTDVYTFGLNKINLMFSRQKYRPSCIVAINSNVLEQNKDFYSETEIPLFLDRHALDVGISMNQESAFLFSSNFPAFYQNCTSAVFQGYTVTYVALQLAFHMGFSSVALVGCDHSYGQPEIANTAQVFDGEDRWHFDNAYFSKGQTWDTPDLLSSELYYSKARDVYELAGRTLIDATVNGALNVFPKVDLADFLTGEDC